MDPVTLALANQRINKVDTSLSMVEASLHPKGILNGDFRLGTRHWDEVSGPAAGTFAVIDGKGVLTHNGKGSHVQLVQTMQQETVPGHKYFVRIKSTFDAGVSSVRVYVAGAPRITDGLGTDMTSVYTETGQGNRFAIYVGAPSDGVTRSVTIHRAMLIDLTDLFGPGNEPSNSKEALRIFDGELFDYGYPNVYKMAQRITPGFPTVSVEPSNFEAVDHGSYPEFDDFVDYANIYALYDGLMNQNEGYVSRIIEGTISTDLGDIEIRRYEFTPPPIVGGYDVPKVLIVTGHHGSERMGMITAYNLMHDLCNRWANDPVLRFLRHGVKFIVYPCINAWGVNASARKNYNGVDLNRNYPTNWRLGNPDSVAYGGPQPLSEFETQCVHNTLQENADTIILSIDLHNFGAASDPEKCVWISSPTQLAKRIASAYIRDLSGIWQAAYPEITRDVVLGFVDGGFYGNGTFSTHATEMGSIGQTLEVNPVFAADGTAEPYDIVSQMRALDSLVNLIMWHLRLTQNPFR